MAVEMAEKVVDAAMRVPVPEETRVFVAPEGSFPRSGRTFVSPYDSDYQVSPSHPDGEYPRNRQRFERNYGIKMQGGGYQGSTLDADRENRSEMVQGEGIERRGVRPLFESEKEDLME